MPSGYTQQTSWTFHAGVTQWEVQVFETHEGVKYLEFKEKEPEYKRRDQMFGELVTDADGKWVFADESYRERITNLYRAPYTEDQKLLDFVNKHGLPTEAK